MTSAMNFLFGDQTNGESPKVRNLRRIDSDKYNQDFVNNIAGLNSATDYMAQYLVVMQKGIDDANKNITQKIQDFIADLIIIFTGGSDTGFEFGDLGYIISALGNLFGFYGGEFDPIGAALHFLTTFGEAGINTFIIAALHLLADLLDMVPFVGDTLSEIVENIADGMNSTNTTASNAQSTATTAQSTATTAQSTATAAQTTANTANSNASTALSTANAAQTTASNAASVAAAAQETADIAYDFSTYREKEFPVTSADLLFGNNETVLGILLAVPPGAIIKLTRLVYSMKNNTGTVTVQLIRRTLAGSESVIHTTNISSSAITYSDNTIDFEISDLDHFFCNVTAISGAVTALHCFVEYVILPAP